ncbi:MULTISPECIES: serine/threonine-protein kinase [unclassified Wenzhouxiangella]|uniref:serine/threonine-protein kinase n=1 Tax=unclassified Wenzhouxiangella TaxID=2613841 RepID=UPI0015F26C74|nr:MULTISPECIES: serine/threonine-protein kinase [unclassified Wenzhouxiangella]
MSDDPLKPGGALEGRLFGHFLRDLSEIREPRPGERIGAWRIEREIGRGGSGVVYLAERADGAYSQQVALKWLRGDRPVPGGRGVLARERELLASLDHPNIARLIDGGETEDGMLWFAMDHVDGATVDGVADSMTLNQRLELVRTLCRAVHHAHRRGLIHGDIKPTNVLVDGRGRPRLVDFGISRIRGAGFGSSYGLTPDYASPEQRRREALTTASDIWQLGRLLEDLVGSEPIPADLRSIIARATAESPEDRYASAEAMGSDIAAWLARRPVTAYDGGALYRLQRLIQRNVLVSAVSAVAVAIIVGGGAWMTLQLAEERDRARAQAERTETALSETKSALARAEALSRFLTDLFRATRPDRPREELPSTEEILDRGAERAMDPEAAPPGERFDMLSTIGQVYRARGRYDDAAPLLETALTLADAAGPLSALDRARARQRLARLMIAAGDPLEDAEALLIEAEGLLAGEADTWDTLVRVRITRTWVERYRGRHDRALALVEPLWWQMPPPGAMDATARAGLLDSLAGLHRAAGDLDRAAAFRDLSLAAFRDIQGEAGQGYVVSLANSVGLEFARGHFEEAERRARRALSLYDRIYDEPVDYRASLRRTLARVLLAAGEVDEAFEVLRDSGEEYARFRGNDPDEWPLYYSTRGHFHVRLGNLDQAAADMQRARELMAEQARDFDHRLAVSVDMLLAWARCRHGDDGQAVLDAIGEDVELLNHQRERAQLREARAACHWRAGEPEAALAELEPLLDTPIPPDKLLDGADRRLLAADILARLDRRDEALARLDEARQAFEVHGLANHPVVERLDRRTVQLR